MRTLAYLSPVFLPVKACQQVYLCLKDEWIPRTVSGTAFILAKIENNGRHLSNKGRIPSYEPDPRCDAQYQYTLSYDEAQFQNDPATGEPYVLTCDGICEVFPYVCTLSKLLPLITP